MPAGTNPMLAVGNDQRNATLPITPDKKNGRKFFAFADFLQIRRDMRIVLGKQVRLACPQQVFSQTLDRRRPAQLADELAGLRLAEQKSQVVVRRRVIFISGFALPDAAGFVCQASPVGTE